MYILNKYLYKRIRLILLTIGISIVNIAVSLWWNAQVSKIINTINTDNAISANILITAVITIFISMGTAYLLCLCSGWTCETLAHDLRMGYARHFAGLSITEIENLNAGEQLSGLQNEIAQVSDFLRNNLFIIVDDIIRLISTFSWILWLNPKLTLLSNIPTVIIICYTTLTSKIIGKTAYMSQEANAQMNGFADTLISIFPIIRLFDAVTLIKNKFSARLDEWERVSILHENRRAKLMSLSAVMTCAPLLLLVLIGGSQVIQGTITLGTLYIFINLSGNVSGVLMNMPGRIGLLRRFSANMKRMEKYLSSEVAL